MLSAAFFYGSICNDADPLCVSIQSVSHELVALNQRCQKLTLLGMNVVIDQFSNTATQLIRFDTELTQVLTSYIVRVNHRLKTYSLPGLFNHPYNPMSWKNITSTLTSTSLTQ